MWKLMTCSASGITEPADRRHRGRLADEGRAEVHVEVDGAGQANGAQNVRKHVHVRSPIILGEWREWTESVASFNAIHGEHTASLERRPHGARGSPDDRSRDPGARAWEGVGPGCRRDRGAAEPGETGMDSETIGQFGASLRGALIGRDAADYDEARKLYNGMIDKRPLLIARCVDVADVIAAVNFGARERAADRDPRRRPQRAGARQLRRRAGDRPVADEGRAGRSGDADGAGRAGLHVGRRRPRDACLRAGGAVRDRLDDRGRAG